MRSSRVHRRPTTSDACRDSAYGNEIDTFRSGYLDRSVGNSRRSFVPNGFVSRHLIEPTARTRRAVGRWSPTTTSTSVWPSRRHHRPTCAADENISSRRVSRRTDSRMMGSTACPFHASQSASTRASAAVPRSARSPAYSARRNAPKLADERAGR